jgi:hypothetical protein
MGICNVIDVPVEGSCITRNGVSGISQMIAQEDGKGEVSLKFVSSKLRRSLHAGATFGVDGLDRFCLAWLEHRGLNGCSAKGSGVRFALRSLEEVEKSIQDSIRGLKNEK